MHAIKERILGNVSGTLGLWDVDPQGRWTLRHRQPNQLQYSWGFIAAQQIGYKRAAHQLDYAISGMYIEFENVADPADPVAIPSYGREEGLEYYSDMLSSGTRDFLRVPLRGLPELGISSGYESYFTPGVNGNMLTMFALSCGTTGITGKTFSELVNSKIIGAALVATPIFSDWTQDVIFARTYLPVDEQVVAVASHQAGLTWEPAFL